MRRLTIYLVVILLVGVLALQNRQSLHLHVFFWTVPAVSVSLVIFGSVLLGGVMSLSFRAYDRIAKRRSVGKKTPESPADGGHSAQ